MVTRWPPGGPRPLTPYPLMQQERGDIRGRKTGKENGEGTEPRPRMKTAFKGEVGAKEPVANQH